MDSHFIWAKREVQNSAIIESRFDLERVFSSFGMSIITYVSPASYNIIPNCYQTAVAGKTKTVLTGLTIDHNREKESQKRWIGSRYTDWLTDWHLHNSEMTRYTEMILNTCKRRYGLSLRTHTERNITIQYNLERKLILNSIISLKCSYILQTLCIWSIIYSIMICLELKIFKTLQLMM